MSELIGYPKIMYVCEECHKNAPEYCGHDRDGIYVAPDGRYLCDSCAEEDENIPDYRELPHPPELYASPKCTCPSGDGSLHWPCPAHLPVTSAVRDVIAECQRHRDNGRDDAHDDSYIDGVLALGGAAYAVSGAGMDHVGTYRQRATRLWPFPCETFKPAGNANRRHDLVRGASMIVAEIERLDRANKEQKNG